jgi:hypothetical protein
MAPAVVPKRDVVSVAMPTGCAGLQQRGKRLAGVDAVEYERHVASRAETSRPHTPFTI